ncbi:MAG: hypothetical protein JL50_20750 [Peptococcaceae bacterium BICA1-7]|nr:MAG: hypothetical protein JL50_20750 [Peptococcaceae bacterium BICA1-7]HBV98512.1 hypothetical protein [Desulfotomaculum sp.]
MSKIKLLYDVITTMKDKESLSGTLKLEGRRDQVKILGLDNEFEKNMAEGSIKAKFSLEMDCEGKKVKHESSTQFDRSSCHGGGQHSFMGRIMAHHCHGHHSHHGHTGPCCGLKERLARLSFLLSVLNSMKVKDQEDKSTVLSLDFADITGEMKKTIHEKLLHKMAQHHNGHQCVCKEFSDLDDLKAGLNILINKNREIEKVTLMIEGRTKDPLNSPRHMDLQAELRFTW